MASLSSRPSVGRKPVGQVKQQHAPQQQGGAAAPYIQAGYHHQPQQQQQQMPGQMQMQQPVYVQGQQHNIQSQASYQQPAPQHPQIYQQQQQQHPQHQQPVQGQSFTQQPGQQQQTQQRTIQQWSGQAQQYQPGAYHQQIAQPQAPQQQIAYQQAHQQPAQQSTQQPVQQRPVQQTQRPIQQQQQQQPQPLQQHSGQPQSIQQPKLPLQQGPIQQQPPQQQTLQHQPFQQQPIQHVQQQQLQQRPVHPQQPQQQQPPQQQIIGQRLPTPNAASHAINRHSISSAASVRSIESATSSHTNPSQTLGSPTSYPASISQQGAPSFITCTLCSTDITNDSSHLECLGCTAAQIPTLFCTNCCVSKGAVVNHHHHYSNFVSPSDVVTFDPEIAPHGWDVRRSAVGQTWYHHKGSKIKTFEKPKPPIPIPKPQFFPGDSILDDGWEEINDPDGRLFYYHRATKVSKWIRPSRNQLPPGWVECTNPDGRTYYRNNMTQATTWDRPSSGTTSSDQMSITSTTGPTLQTTGWSPTDKRHSLSSQGQNTATPQSPTSVRGSTILETTEWSPEVETSTVSAFRTASVPNNFIETTNWAPSDPTHRPIPTRADTTPLPEAYRHQPYGNRKLPSGSNASTNAVVKSTKTAAHATAKGVKSAGQKLKNSKTAQTVVAGVATAAVNAVLVNQLGIRIPGSVGKAAVSGLVNSIDFDKKTTTADGTGPGVTANGVTGNSVDASGNVAQPSILNDTGVTSQSIVPDGVGNFTNVNTVHNMAGNDYIVGRGSEVVQTTVVQEEVVFIPGGPVPMGQQPMVQQTQQTRSISTRGGPQHTSTGAPHTAGSGSSPGTSEWEFESIMQRPAAMIGSHIPIHVPKTINQGTAPAVGSHSQRPMQHQGPGPVGQGSLPQSHIPVHSHRPPNTMSTSNQPQQQIPTQFHNPGLSQASHQPGWAGQPQIRPQNQGQFQQHLPTQSQVQPQANQAHMPFQQQAFKPQGMNQSQFNQQANKPQFQGPQPQNSGPQRPQNQYPNKPPGATTSQTPSKPLLKPQQKKALMNVGVKIGTSLLKHAIRSSLSGNSGGDDYDDDNDNSFDFGDTSNDGGDDFDSSNNFDNDTIDYDPQDQVQDQFADQDQQFDGGFGGNGIDPGTSPDMTNFGGNDQFGGTDSFADSGAGYSYDGQDQLGTDTSGNDTDFSAQAGFSSPTDTAFNQQQAIDIQAQGIDQASMNDDNAAMNGFFTTPDFTGQSPSFQTSMADDNAAMNGFYTTPDITTQNPGIFQTSMADDNAAMNGFSTSSDGFNVQSDSGYGIDTSQSIDPSFSENTVSDPSNDAGSITADNLWTMNLPQTSSLQSITASQAYAGLTSSSLSGPMFDYYDSFAAFGGEIPLDEESDEDPTQDIGVEGDTSNDDQADGLLQDPTLTSANLDSAGLPDQDFDAPSSPGLNMDVNQQPSDQSQDTDNESVTQADDIGSTTPTNADIGAFSIPQAPTTAISQLYDGSGYGGPDSASNSPVDTQSTTPTGTGTGVPNFGFTGDGIGTGTGAGMSGMPPNAPPTPPMIPATTLMPDPMPDPALLIVGQ